MGQRSVGTWEREGNCRCFTFYTRVEVALHPHPEGEEGTLGAIDIGFIEVRIIIAHRR